MSIHKIEFTSSLLNNKINLTDSDTKNPVAINESAKDITPENEDESSSNTSPVNNGQPENSNKIRNWSIGLSAAAVLLGLGIAGRKGHLGKGIQKALGGAEKESEHIASHTNPHLATTADDISAEEIEHITTKDTDLITGETPKTKLTEDEIPEVQKQTSVTATEEKQIELTSETTTQETPQIIKQEETLSETAAETGNNEAVKTVKKEEPVNSQEIKNSDSKPKIKEEPVISKEEIDSINAALDRTIPKITEENATAEVKTLASFIEEFKIEEDFSKYKLGVYYYYKQPLANGDTAVMYRDAYHELFRVERLNPDNKEVYHVSYDHRYRSFDEILEYGKQHPELKPDEVYKYCDNHPFETRTVRFGKYQYEYIEGELKRITKYVDKDIHYNYSPDGNLEFINYFKNGRTSRLVYFDKEHNITKIRYVDPNNFGHDLKVENFKDGDIISEIYNKDGKNIEIKY